MGHVVNVASRVADLADGGTSLITSEVRESAGTVPNVLFGHIRSERLAGLDEDVEVSEVLRA